MSHRSLLNLLPVLVGAVPLLAQASRPTDWDKDVRAANQHARLMVRSAAGRKVAAAGGEAVPAIRRFTQQHGSNALTLEFVFSYTRTEAKDTAILTLLEEWAKDKTFYWRSQALWALANRRLPQHRDLFVQGITDPSHLMRIQSGRGLLGLARSEDQPAVRKLLQDEDPRVRVEIAAALLEAGAPEGLPTLVWAVQLRDEFLGDPWGRRSAEVALQALSKRGGQRFKLDDIAAIETYARTLLPDLKPLPPPTVDATRYQGGLEIRSCRNGDLFIRWTATGQIVFGLDGRVRAGLPEPTWRKFIGAVPGKVQGVHGKVVCDFARLLDDSAAIHVKSAPAAMRPEDSSWLTLLADALRDNGQPEPATWIGARLEQFASRKQ